MSNVFSMGKVANPEYIVYNPVYSNTVVRPCKITPSAPYGVHTASRFDQNSNHLVWQMVLPLCAMVCFPRHCPKINKRLI